MRNKKEFDSIVFDIDNVIADTRFSYTDCIRETVQTYLARYFKLKPSQTFLLSKKDVEYFKLLGGFNDDWDTCYGLLLYILFCKRDFSGRPSKLSTSLTRFLKKVKSPLYVQGIEKICGKNKRVSLLKISRIFQKLYWKKYINRESLIIPKTVFKKLRYRGIKLGIATGRTKKEANYVLKKFGIRGFIGQMICSDHLSNKKLKKPHPYSLLVIGNRYGENAHYLYIGDLPDDMQMARRASKKMNIECWGFMALSSDQIKMRKALKKAGAKQVIKSKSELVQLLSCL